MKFFKPINDFFKSISGFFYLKYYALYELITLRLMRTLNNMVRKLIISKGKNPDYVAPSPVMAPPTPHIILDQDQINKRISKAHEFIGSINTGSYPFWVKDPSRHPVIQSRKAYQQKLNAPIVLEDEPFKVAAVLNMSGPLDKQSLLDAIDYLEEIDESEK